jgi:hypothetical protein
MLEIKTIVSPDSETFDYNVNEAMKEGWELNRRECYITGSDRATTFYAELSRFVLPDAVDPELDEYEEEAHWVIHRDPMHPYHCSECSFKSTTPYAVCPSCGRLMSADMEGKR